MNAEFSVKEILLATKGKPVCGETDNVRFRGVSTDSRSVKTGELFIAIKGERFDGHDFAGDAINRGAVGVIIHRRCKLMGAGCRYPVIMVDDTTEALGDIARHYRRRFRMPVIAVTGSNGKTTTKEMIASILKRRCGVLHSFGTENNNIGVPRTLLGLSRAHDAVVLELGTNHPGEIRRLAEIASPTIGVITNVGPSHLEGLGDAERVFREKMDLFAGFGDGEVAILNGDDSRLSRVSSRRYRIARFGTRRNSDFIASDVVFDERGFAFRLNGKFRFRVNLLGRHNLYNALAAIAAAKILRVPYDGIKQGLLRFRAPKMRMEKIELNGITIINDAYNSNPLSMSEAITWLGSHKSAGRKFLIAGDMLELGKGSIYFHKKAGEIAARRNLDYVVCYGRLSRSMCDGAVSAGLNPNRVIWFNSASRASDVASFLKDLLKPGDVALVKGSRAMKMEETVKCFTTYFTR